MLLQREKGYLQGRDRILFPKENSIRTSILDNLGDKVKSFAHCNSVDLRFFQVKPLLFLHISRHTAGGRFLAGKIWE